MKHYYLLLILVFSSMIPFAQTNTFPTNGNVGIGSTIPEAKLHIQSDANTSGAPSNSQMIVGGITNPEKRLSLAYNTSSNYAELQSQAYPGAYTVIALNPNGGNVGIGTTNVDNIQGWNKVLQVHGTNHAKFLVTESSGVKVGIFSHATNNGKIGTESNHNLTLTAGYWNDVMTLTTAGNVGIGTLLPAEKLSVNGKIRAHEIKVEATNWPDYVFTKSYQLPTLQETEKHVREKGHLPGIPSAEEVKTNGVDLGEMNAKLLQKIEELTLHLIEMRKELDELKKK